MVHLWRDLLHACQAHAEDSAGLCARFLLKALLATRTLEQAESALEDIDHTLADILE